MKKFYILLFILSSFTFIQSKAQSILDNHFKFKDGVYLSAEEYFSDRPAIIFSEGNLPFAKYGKFNESQFENLYYNDNEGKKVKLNIKDIWGISVKGVAYVFCGFSVANETDISFLANTIRRSRNLIFNEVIYVGNISLYSFKHEPWMIKANSTKATRITKKNVRSIIEDDQELLSQYKKERKKGKNKLAFLVQYNKRHPLTFNQLAHRN